ncbi:MAG: TonB-dependent receptor domain-containing protein, partial [Bryobacteraceae bacterium]
FDVRLGYARGKEKRRPWSDGFDVASLGFPASYQNLVQSRAFPTVGVTGFQGLAGSEFQEQPGDTWSLQSSASFHRGRHLIKTGGEGRMVRGHFFTNNAPSGSFNFSPLMTGGPRADTPAGGFAMASLLVGYGTGSMQFNSGVSVQNLYSGFYVQDDWRLTPKLTLNLGLRWEYEGPRTERYNRTTRGFAYEAQSPLRVPGLDLRGGLLYAGAGGLSRGLYDPDKNNFAPRFGFAYSADRRTVVRGGYSLSYIPVIGSVQPTGFSNTTPWVNSTDGGITPRDRLSNPFPVGLLPPIGSSEGLLTLVGQGVSFVEPGDVVPVFHNWQFNIQRELPGQILIQAGYVGSRAQNIFGSEANVAQQDEQNQLHPSFLSMGTGLTQTVNNPFFGIITSGALSGRTVQRQQLLRPYPQYTSVRRLFPAHGNNTYHSAQFSLEKRFARGVGALVSYTIAKNLSDVQLALPQNNYDRRAERAVGDFDVPQRLTITAQYALPFGQGRRFLGQAPRAADLLIGGWELSTFSTFQGGFPLSFSLSSPNLLASGAGTQRPNAVGDPKVEGSHASRLRNYFNKAAFAQPAPFTFGNLSSRVASVRSPGMNNVNLTLSKDFRVTERVKTQFRASSFNLANHPVFSGPNTTFGDANFGIVSGQANLSRQTEFALKIVF